MSEQSKLGIKNYVAITGIVQGFMKTGKCGEITRIAHIELVSGHKTISLIENQLH
jgi:hypothetical protein